MNKESWVKKILSGKKKFILAITILALIAIVWLFTRNGKENGLNIISVSRGNINQEVLVSGIVKSLNYVDLAFEKSGTVIWINKKVGDAVYQGEIIATLENGTEEAALEDAEAKLKSEEARYRELANGNRPEEIKVKKSELAKAKQDLDNYYSNVAATINDAYNKADNAVNKQTDAIFSNDQTSNPDVTFSVIDLQIKNDALSARTTVTNNLKYFRGLNDAILSEEKTASLKEASLAEAKSYLLKIQNFLVKTSSLLDNATNLSETTLATYKDNVNTGRTNVNTAIQSVSTLIDNIASQKITVEKTNLELELEKLGSTNEVLEQQKSAIMRAEAGVKSAESALRKTIIRSPINGVVTKQDAKVGEIANSGTKLASVMSANEFKMEANVPEADLSKLNVGDKATVTLDAYGNETEFDATITSIEPAEQIIDGVSTYKTTLVFDNVKKPVRSGMTANITIKTEGRTGVLLVPQKAVFSKNGKKFVNLLSEMGIIEKEVLTGLRGTNGMIEITSGLNDTEKIILPSEKK